MTAARSGKSKARQALSAGAAYFLVVFAVGFLFGVIRVLVMVPMLGERRAELGELPLMLMVSWLAARWVVRRFALLPRSSAAALTGVVALALLLGAELWVVLGLRGVAFADYVAERDLVSGSAYLLSLLWFAVLPWWVRPTRH